MTKTITANETAVLLSIAHNYFGDGPGTEIWADCINDSSKPSGIEGKALSGVVASLAKKGLIVCSGNSRDAGIRITESGIGFIPTL
jgi:hypothetical protein